MNFKNLVLIIIAAFVVGFLLAIIPYINPEPVEVICGLENCHGLDISCGDDIPEACTEIYMLGDFCRDFAKCEVVNGDCLTVETAYFRECRECVENCNSMSGDEVFVCEGLCRESFA